MLQLYMPCSIVLLGNVQGDLFGGVVPLLVRTEEKFLLMRIFEYKGLLMIHGILP